jgi:GNAT superfamily N-acetyltransferase
MARNKDINLDDLVRALEKQAEGNVESQQKLSKLSLKDFELKHHPDLDQVEMIDPKTGKQAGSFQWVKEHIKDPSVVDPERYFGKGERRIPLDGFIKMDYPHVEPEYRGRGLGGQMYKHIEELTGKKIMPDTELSPSSLALQGKKGLGKSFGSDNYKPGIIKGILDSLGDTPVNRKLAEQLYKDRKDDMMKAGLKGFKSILPMLGKIGAGAATAGLSLASEAADTTDMDAGGQLAHERELAERKRRDSATSKNSEMQKLYDNIDSNYGVSPGELLDTDLDKKAKIRALKKLSGL